MRAEDTKLRCEWKGLPGRNVARPTRSVSYRIRLQPLRFTACRSNPRGLLIQ